MRKAMVAVALLMGCGDIREVPVDNGTAPTNATTSATGSPADSTSGDAPTTGVATTDNDTEVGSSDGPPPPPPPQVPVPKMVCTTKSVFFDARGVAEVPVDLEGHGVVADFDIGVRMLHEEVDQVAVTLVRDTEEWLLLRTGDGASCGASLEAFFDADGAAPEEICTKSALDELGAHRIRPAEDFTDLLADSVDGAWVVRVTAPPSDGAVVDAVCLATTAVP